MSSEKTDTRKRILEATWRLMEKRQGQGVRVSDIAQAVGISRQALYLHFASRSELMIATVTYVDKLTGLNERFKAFKHASNSVELLEVCVEVWGSSIPEIYGIAKALLSTRDTDEASNEAWNDRMACLRNACREIIEALEREGRLSPQWSRDDAIEMMIAMLSIHNWEHFTIECGWSNERYIDGMKTALKQTFVVEAIYQAPSNAGLNRIPSY
jgi:AcrR family transcriptional regulator